MAKSDETKGKSSAGSSESGGAPPAAPEAKSIDAQGSDQRQADLKSKHEAALGELELLQKRMTEVVQENADLRAENAALRKDNAQLERLVPVKAPSGSVRLKESTVIFRHDQDRSRAYGKRGDVLLVNGSSRDVQEAQRSVGQAATVYAISEEDAEELHRAGHLEVS